MTNIVCSAVLIIFLANSDRDDSAFVVGVIMAATGVGGLIGSAATEPSRRSASAASTRTAPSPGRCRCCWCTCGCGSRPWSCWRFNQESWAFLVALLIMGLAGGRSNVTIREFSGLHVAPEKLGRVVGVTRLFGFGAVAIGPLVGGVLGRVGRPGHLDPRHAPRPGRHGAGLHVRPPGPGPFFKDGDLEQAAQPAEFAHVTPVSWRRPKSTLDRAERARQTRAPLNGLRRAELSELLT